MPKPAIKPQVGIMSLSSVVIQPGILQGHHNGAGHTVLGDEPAQPEDSRRRAPPDPLAPGRNNASSSTRAAERMANDES